MRVGVRPLGFGKTTSMDDVLTIPSASYLYLYIRISTLKKKVKKEDKSKRDKIKDGMRRRDNLGERRMLGRHTHQKERSESWSSWKPPHSKDMCCSRNIIHLLHSQPQST